MRTIRIFEDNVALTPGETVELGEYGAGHVSRVLRLKAGDAIRIFDGKGHEFEAQIAASGKKTLVRIGDALDVNVESPLDLELLQVISRGDRMDFTIQKAVELGIKKIVPLFSERCGVKLDAERAAKKVESYRRIAIAACEQCGRNEVPEISPVTDLADCLRACANELQDAADAAAPRCISLTLDPYADLKIDSLARCEKYRLLIGPEGGFTEDEVRAAKDAGFTGVTLGPRILRTETAALTALSVIGSRFGDL